MDSMKIAAVFIMYIFLSYMFHLKNSFTMMRLYDYSDKIRTYSAVTGWQFHKAQNIRII